MTSSTQRKYKVTEFDDETDWVHVTTCSEGLRQVRDF